MTYSVFVDRLMSQDGLSLKIDIDAEEQQVDIISGEVTNPNNLFTKVLADAPEPSFIKDVSEL